jgi:hypothetical protein
MGGMAYSVRDGYAAGRVRLRSSRRHLGDDYRIQGVPQVQRASGGRRIVPGPHFMLG